MRATTIFASVLATMLCPWATAQSAWDILEDAESTSVCGVVNAVNSATGATMQLVILTETAELMIVSRDDVIVDGSIVDLDNNVFDFGNPSGFIGFAEDGDGFRTVWWLSLDGTVVEVDPFTAAATAGTLFPEEFGEVFGDVVGCDACEFVDDPPEGVCQDVPDDGSNPPIVINFCGNGVGSMGMVAMTLCGFAGLHFVRRRM